MSQQTTIREEEMKNRIATLYFEKCDCTRIDPNLEDTRNVRLLKQFGE